MIDPSTSCVGLNPQASVGARQHREANTLPVTGSLIGKWTTLAIEGRSKLKLQKNRSGSYTAEIVLPNTACIAGTGVSPSDAIEQLESAIENEWGRDTCLT